MNKTSLSIALVALAVLATVKPLAAQISYSIAGSTITEDFDWTQRDEGPPVVATFNFTWQDNVAAQAVPAGTWQAGADSTGWYSETTTGSVGNGNNFTGDMVRNFYFVSADTDRSLGGRPTAGGGPIIIGMRINNATGGTLNSFDLDYRLEVMGTRDGSPGTNEVHSVVEYFVGTPTDWITDSFTNIASLAADLDPATNAAVDGTFELVDGNAAGNFAALTSSNNAFSAANGQDIWIRWTLTGDGSDFNVGIDDVSFSAVPEPSASFLLISVLALLCAWRGARRTA